MPTSCPPSFASWGPPARLVSWCEVGCERRRASLWLFWPSPCPPAWTHPVAGLLGNGHGPMCARAACGTHGLPFIHRPALPSGAAGAALAALLVAILSREATAGKCIEPPKGATAFCGIDFQVYVSSDTQANDTAYWFTLDRRAEKLTEEWEANMGCSKSVLAGESWCKNYACAMNFQRCTTFKDAPLAVCRQSCVDCFRTCEPDRPFLPPGMYAGPDNEDRTYGAQYKETQYDTWSKAYRCQADHKLIDGGKFLFWSWGSACTGAGTQPQRCFLACFLACAAALFLSHQA